VIEQVRLLPARTPREIIERAIGEHGPSKLFVLFSGGKDSTVMLDVMAKECREYITGVVHVRTGISVPQTLEFCAERTKALGLEFIDLHTKANYWEMIREYGFPGPGIHNIYYNELKGDVIDAFVQSEKSKSNRFDRIALVTGVRIDESKLRAQTSRDVERDGAQVWAAPIIDWTTPECMRYREEHHVPMSEAALLLCMSGDCLCGAKADGPEEIKPIEACYPEIAAELHAPEPELKAAGIIGWQYANGIRGNSRAYDEQRMKLCANCLRQSTLWSDVTSDDSVRVANGTESIADAQVKPRPGFSLAPEVT
jgi:3'-phosphoadenosine 5'-phosphosulfate sulfotransferase (PAPS reductase)/FAD synthetase